jgi:hypothetical protein
MPSLATGSSVIVEIIESDSRLASKVDKGRTLDKGGQNRLRDNLR